MLGANGFDSSLAAEEGGGGWSFSKDMITNKDTNNVDNINNDTNTNTPIKQSFSQSIAGRFRGSSLFQGIRILSDTPEHIRIREGGPMAGRRRTVGARPTGTFIKTFKISIYLVFS